MAFDRRSIEQTLSAAHAEAQHEVWRIAGQLEFAEGLCELHPAKAGAWRKLIAKAAALATGPASRGGVSGLRRAVRDAEQILAPIGKAAKRYTVYCVGHAHIDMNWMWSWPETVGVTHDTFDTVLKLMDEYPDFCFTQSQASVYAIIEEHDPGMLARIRERVREGRWEAAASHWVENDKNLVSGEALCRHLLYTRRYMRKLFGLAPEDVPLDWSPDTFGHAATIPSYLVRGGVRRYYGHRFGGARPEVFWWEAPDGSRVLVRNDMANGYNGQIREKVHQRLLRYARESGLCDFMFVFGVGDHGGGPTRRDIEWAHELDTWPIYPRVKLSTTAPFYAALERDGEKLPVLKGELNFEFTGCYTTQTLIKRSNCLAETQLVCAETSAALAGLVGGLEYPAEAMREAWQNTLFSHFHDILPGSGVHDTRTYAHGQFQKTAARTSTLETLALRALAAKVDTSAVALTAPGGAAKTPGQVRGGLGAGAGYNTAAGLPSGASHSPEAGPKPFLIFNPCAAERTGVGVVTVWDSFLLGDHRKLAQRPFTVVTPSGKRWRAQAIHSAGYAGHYCVQLAFPLDPVPGLGYGVYTVLEEETPPPAPLVACTGTRKVCSYAALERSVLGMENEFLGMEVDTATAGLRSLRVRGRDAGAPGVPARVEQELLDPARPAAVLEYAVERPHAMTAWCVHDTGPRQLPEVLSLKRVLEGPYVATIEARLRIAASEFTVTYELRAGEPQLDVRLEGTWFERGSPETGVPQLRMAFPAALTAPRARYEIPFGTIDRDEHSGEEVPALRWAQVSGRAAGKQAGLLLLNDCKHGHSLDGDVLRLTLIRSAYEPDILPEIGRHEMRLALAPFAGALETAQAARLAAAHVNPLRVMGTDVHKGELPAAGCFFALAPDNVALSCLKPADDGEGLVLRLYETAGKKTVATVRAAPFPSPSGRGARGEGGPASAASATPHPTLSQGERGNNDARGRPLAGALAEVVETDLLERPLPESSAKLSGDTVSVALAPFGIATVRLRFGR